MKKLITILTILSLCLPLKAQTDTVYTISYAGSSYKIVYDTTVVQDELGAELISNRTFDSNLNGWGNTGDFTWESDGQGGGRARHNIGTSGSIYQTGVLDEDNAFYRVTYTVGGMSEGTVRARCGSNGDGTTRSSDGTYTEDIQQQFNGSFLLTVSTDFDGWVDDVSVKKILE